MDLDQASLPPPKPGIVRPGELVSPELMLSRKPEKSGGWKTTFGTRALNECMAELKKVQATEQPMTCAGFQDAIPFS